MCIIDMGSAISRTIASDLWENGKAPSLPQGESQQDGKVFLWCSCGYCVQKMFTIDPTYIYDLKIDPLQRLHLLRSAKPDSLFSMYNRPDSVYLYRTPHLLVHPCTITLTPQSTGCNKHIELPGCCGFSNRKLTLLDPDFCKPVCLYFLHPLTTPVRCVPGAVQKMQRSFIVPFLYQPCM